jgi:hypothetical protein
MKSIRNIISMKRKIKRFFKPNIINVSFSVICLGLTWKFLIPLLKYFKIVPCRIYTEVITWGLCPIDPTVMQSTYYFGYAITDHIYLTLYLIIFGIIIPYTLACLLFHLYYKYIRNIIQGK